MSGMISRVADHCFWMGRYVERGESTARLLQATRGLALDTELTPEECWRPMLVVAGEEASFLKRFGEPATGDAETVEEYMTWDEANFSGLVMSVRAARENARSVREAVSHDAWEVLNELHIWLGSTAARDEFRGNRYGFYKRVRESIQLVLGLLRSTMLHDTPLDFIWLGAMLERAGQTARLLDVHHPAGKTPASRHPIVEMSIWLSLLRAASALEPFMQRNRGKVTPQGAAALLILEPKLPRSVRYGIHASYEKLCRIRPPGDSGMPGAESVARLGALEAWISAISPASLDPAQVHDYLTHVVNEVTAVCDTIGREFFGYEAPASTASQEQSAA